MIGTKQTYSELGNIPSTHFSNMGTRAMGGAMEQDGGDRLGSASGYGGYYGGNIPSTSYSLLLGACRLGIEPLIYATLQLPSMATINRAQLIKARELAEEYGHMNAAKVLGIICGVKGQEPTEQILANKKSKEALRGLDNVNNYYNLKGKDRDRLSMLCTSYAWEVARLYKQAGKINM